MEQPRIWLSLVLLAASILLIPSGKRMAFAQEDNTESDFDRLLPRHHLRHHRPPSIRQHERHPDQQQQQQQLDVAEEETVVARRSFPNGNTNGCVSCAGRDLFLNFTKEELRVEILRKLGMRAPPEVAARKIMPKHVVRHLMHKHSQELGGSNEVMNDEPMFNSGESDHLAGFEMDEALDEDDYHFQTKQINILAQSPEGLLPEKLIRKWGDVQFFSMASPHLHNGLWKGVFRAKLLINLPPAPTPEDTEAWISIFSGNLDKIGSPFLSQSKGSRVRLRADKGGWTDVNVFDLVSQWFKDPNSNLGLIINVTTSTGKKLDVGIQHQTSNAPYIQLEIKENNMSNRNKRNLGKVCSEETDSAETHCCLWPFTVDFEKEYGWTFIIHPSKYEANFCAGDCSLGVIMPTNTYGHLIQQSNFSPCCTPQKMSGINLLYMDEDRNVILGKLPKMKVERCGCA